MATIWVSVGSFSESQFIKSKHMDMIHVFLGSEKKRTEQLYLLCIAAFNKGILSIFVQE